MGLPLFGISRVLFLNGCKPNRLQNYPQLPKLILTKNHESLCNSANINVRRTLSTFNSVLGVKRTFINLFRRGSIVLVISQGFNKIPAFLKYNSVNVFKNCLAQFEFVVAHRIRRGQQMFSLYTRLWDEVALKQFANKIRRQLMTRGKDLLLGVAAVSVFNWDIERIPEEEILKHTNELEVCHKLKNKLVNFKSCQASEPSNPQASEDNPSTTESYRWEPFINDGDLMVWKMEEETHKGSGLFCYKMFGRYNDVTANDFFLAFLDTLTRKEWDTHVVSLYVVESEPSTNSDVLYWETKWPTLFSNRDYVFKRRYKIDHERKLMTIVNKSTEHPSIPVYPNKTRVSEYWSFLIIKPLTDDFDKPGIEFSLTYFDNPGTSLPTAISQWVSATGMPDYLNTLRFAALAVAKKKPIELSEEKEVPLGGGESRKEVEEVEERREPPPPPPAAPPSNSPPQERLTPLAVYVHWAISYLL